MHTPMTKERLQVLWLAAMEGLSASREDVLDLIDEIQHLRVTCDLPTAQIPPNALITIGTDRQPDPWAVEWPVNP